MSDAPPIRRLWFDPDTRRIGLRVGKVELGQHIHAAYRTLVAEALSIADVHIHVLPVTSTDSPDDGLTVGSLSIQVTGRAIETAVWVQMEDLRAAAAQRLGSDPCDLTLDPETLLFRKGILSCDLFDLVAATECTRIQPTAADPIARAILGKTTFIQDMTLPDMVFARALRGRVVAIIEPLLSPEEHLIQDDGFAAIVTPDEARLDVLWAQLPDPPAPKDHGCDGPVRDWIETRRVITSGDASPTQDLPHKISATRPFLLHGSIAPSCGLARWDGQVLEVWTHTQGIFPLRAQIARTVGLTVSQVVLHHMRSAGCYGHNGADDAAMDAALIAMQTKGRPVRVTWPREDDTRLAPLGAPMLVEASARLDDNGRISHWHQRIYSAPHGQRPGGGGHVNLLAALERDPTLRPRDIGDLPMAVGGGASRNATPIYDIPHATVRTHIAQDLPVRTSSLRGLGAQMNTVAIEGMMDHLARETGQSPIDFRLRHLSDPRARAVLKTLNARCPNVDAPDEALGIALGRYKNKAAFSAVAVHMRLVDEPQMLAVHAVVDAGRIISTDGVCNQIEGGILQAASWTLCEAAHLRDGQVDARGWDDYPTLPWDRVPPLDIHLMTVDDAPALGVGECMVGPTSAAIVNGVSACLGQPVTDLPLTREALIRALS